jgi:hypothetical protein
MKTKLANLNKRRKRAAAGAQPPVGRIDTLPFLSSPHPLAGFEPSAVRSDRCAWVEPWVEWYRVTRGAAS